MERDIIKIDEDKCTGCGMCVPGCPEGALQIIDGKARLISDLFCDGLGACIGECPEGAIHIEKREAEPYDERKVMENIIKAGPNTVRAHLSHLKDHGETAHLKTAVDVLKEKKQIIPDGFGGKKPLQHGHAMGGCPGSRMIDFTGEDAPSSTGDISSQLKQWPVQMHLVSPVAPYFQHADVVLAADCTAYAVGDFHQRFMKGKALAIACPKLDEGMDIYLAKLTALIDEAEINTLTVVIMQVPCCGGLIHLAQKALSQSGRKIPVKKVVVGIKGDILTEEWL
ncbi:4Fe-4S binding protein [bacterium]|nr:4Fe-4S binding protein [bacterium]